MSFQNPDGGFGESTLSYLDDGHRGRGESTPTQTAWVLSFSVKWGCTIPIRFQGRELPPGNRSESESWRDGSVVGTGHPGILYVEYPVYPKVFPVMALASYLNPH